MQGPEWPFQSIYSHLGWLLLNTLTPQDLRKLWQCAYAGTTPNRPLAFLSFWLLLLLLASWEVGQPGQAWPAALLCQESMPSPLLPPPQPLSLHPEAVCSPVGGAGNEKSSRGWLEGPDKQSPLPCYPAPLWGPCLLSLGGRESEHLFSSSSCLNESPACTCWFLENAHISQ